MTTRKPRTEMPDIIGARELKLFIENDGDLYRQQGLPILVNLAKKKAKGSYDPVKAAKLYKYLADNGAKKYGKEYGGQFSPDTRRETARQLARDFEDEAAAGNYGLEFIKRNTRRR